MMHVMICYSCSIYSGKKVIFPVNLSPYWKNTCLPLRMKYTDIKNSFSYVAKTYEGMNKLNN